MSSSTRPRRASLAAYLSSPTIPVYLPSLPSSDLQHALNAQKYTPGNNDVLEFIGDRVVNLACALMASKINHSPDQQTLYARRLSNNDTLGRIAHQLRLPQHAKARLDRMDRCAAENWSRRQVGSPPKLFADLFESYAGAVFLRHGWHYTHAWLKKVYEPIIAAAARDAFATTEVAPLLWSVPDAQPWPQQKQWAFEDFIDEGEDEMKDAIKAVMQSLPRSEVSLRRQEVGMQLLKLWICEFAFGVYPEIHSARDRGAHFLSCITNALMSVDTLGHLGLLLSLSSYLPPSDPDFLVSYPVLESIKDEDTAKNLDCVKPKVAAILKALVGAFYLRHPTRARKWGHKWLRPFVCWTMGTLLRVGRYRPIIGSSPLASPEPTHLANDESSKPDIAIDTLLNTFEHLAIDSKLKLKTHKRTSSKTSDGTQKTKPKPKKYTIKISAPWLFGCAGSDDDAKDDEKKLQLDLDIELDPYRLLDEGGTFPAPEPEHKNTPDEGKDEDGKEKNSCTSESKQPESTSTKETVEVAGDSDGSQDMEFSSSSSGTESDMEFSSDEEEISVAQRAGDKEKHENETENGEEKEGDDLTRALERLEIKSSEAGTERGIGHSTIPATCSEGRSSSSSPISGPFEISKSQETHRKDERGDANPTATEEDELEDMEFSSSEESAIEDSGEKDMEFSSDDDKEQSDTLKSKVAKDGVPSETIPPPKSKSRLKSKKEAIEDSGEKDMKFSSDEDKEQSDTLKLKVAKDRVPSTTMPPSSESKSKKEYGNQTASTPSKARKVRVPLSTLPLDINFVKARTRQRASKNTAQLDQSQISRREMSKS